MRLAWLLVIVCLHGAACASSQEAKPSPRARQSSKATLAEFCASSTCDAAEPTREEAKAACHAPTSAMTRREGKCGPYAVLIEDSELVTSSRYYDTAGKLVAVRVFSHEWGNRTDYGTIPECSLGALIDICHYGGGTIAPASPAPAPEAAPAPPGAPAPTAAPAP